MVSAHPYWVPVYQGFKQAAAAMGCKTIFSGTPDYDITKQIASFEQDLAKKTRWHPAASDAGRSVH
jgi:ribose transport system substrate-binding protein